MLFRMSVEDGNIRGCKKNWLRIAGKMEEKLQICGDVSKYAGNTIIQDKNGFVQICRRKH
jgi:hypothetical protein